MDSSGLAVDVTFTSSRTMLPGGRDERIVIGTITGGQLAQTSSIDRNKNKVLYQYKLKIQKSIDIY